MSAPRLRVSHVVVQPVLVWDDGEELSPGPQCQPIQVPLSALPELADHIRRDVSEQEKAASEQAGNQPDA